MRVFVLAPHFDDEVLGVGGTIAWHVARGDEIHVGILTRGNPAMYSKEEAVQDYIEAEEAHGILGVTRTYCCQELYAPGLDTFPHHVVTGVISTWLQKVRPAVLFVPHRGDIHLDHRLAYQSALVAARPGYSSVQRILSYETLSETEWSGPSHEDAFLPNVFVNISEHLELKQKAMQAYRSQIKAFPNPRSIEGIETLARFRGATIQVPAAEAFSLVREVM